MSAVYRVLTGMLLLALCSAHVVIAQAGEVIDLTLERTIQLALAESYRVRQLQLGIEETRSRLRAERAGLKSNIYLELTTPEFEAVSDYKWNSELRRDEIIRENTRLWQTNFSIRQPVVLFGYPTNGYLSLNNRVYRYTQFTEDRSVTYYNRYFIRYEQPLFQPNRLKNAIERAELALNEQELGFQENIVNLLDDIADDYFDLFNYAYRQVIFSDLIRTLEEASEAASKIVHDAEGRSMELNQIQVELVNARERLKAAQSSYRLESARLRRRLRLDARDSLRVDAILMINKVNIDVQQAIQFGSTLRPRLRRLEMERRFDEIDIENVRGEGAFRANLEVTYGREMQDARLAAMFQEPTNSYSVGMHAYVPIWDWGRRRARIQAEKISLQRTELEIEEAREEIQSEIANAVQNVVELQERALTMQQNLEMARNITRSSMDRYSNSQASVLELMQSIDRETDTALGALEAFLSYRQALSTLQQLTYYDFEHSEPLIERYREGLIPDED